MVIAGVLVGISTMIGQAATLPDRIEFKSTPKLGKVTRLNLISKNVGSMKMGEVMPEQKFSQTMEQELKSVCVKVNKDGTAVYEMTMPVIGMKMDAGGFKSEFHFDSSKPDNVVKIMPQTQIGKSDGFTKILSAMTKIKYTMTVDSDGKPIKVERYAESLKKALQDQDNASAPEKAFVDMLKAMSNDDTMLDQTKSRYSIFPSTGTVRVGETWHDETEMKMPMFNMLIQTRSDYKLVGIEEFRGRPCGKVEIKQTMKILPHKANSGQAKSIFDSFEFNVAGSDGQGIAYLDYQNREVVQLHQTQRMNMDITMKNIPGDNGTKLKNVPTHMQQKITNSISIDLIEPNSP